MKNHMPASCRSFLPKKSRGRPGSGLKRTPALRGSHTLTPPFAAAYLHVSPERLVLVSDSLGKPRLAINRTAPSVQPFPLRRDGLVCLCPGARGRVDVEKMDRDVDELDIARRMFTQAEARRLETLQGDERTAAFFNSWTRLEALAKASGRGLGSVSPGKFLRHGRRGIKAQWRQKAIPGHEAAWQVISLQRVGIRRCGCRRGPLAGKFSAWNGCIKRRIYFPLHVRS